MASRNTRVWLVTGASSGFGRAIAEAALERGDTVVATARHAGRLDELVRRWPDTVVPTELDVTDLQAAQRAVDDIVGRLGRLDVLVNNAGRTQVGAVEETTDEELRALFEVHVFGPFALTRAALPHMRRRGSGWIVQMSSIGGQLSYAGFGAYSATKCALEGFSEALAEEVAPYGIRVLIVEPGEFRTDLFSSEAAHRSGQMPEYAETVGKTRAYIEETHGRQPGDPALAAGAILSALDSTEPPLRLPLGADAVDAIRLHLDAVRGELEAWEPTSRSTAYATAATGAEAR